MRGRLRPAVGYFGDVPRGPLVLIHVRLVVFLPLEHRELGFVVRPVLFRSGCRLFEAVCRALIMLSSSDHRVGGIVAGEDVGDLFARGEVGLAEDGLPDRYARR